MDKGVWWVYRVHRVAKSWTQLNDSLKHTPYRYKLDGQNQALHQVRVDPRVAGRQSQLLWVGQWWQCHSGGLGELLGALLHAGSDASTGPISSACLRLSSRWAHPHTRKRYPCSAGYEGLVHTLAASCCPPHTRLFSVLLRDCQVYNHTKSQNHADQHSSSQSWCSCIFTVWGVTVC